MGELLETCLAEWRKIRLDGARLPVGPPVARVAHVESRFEKITSADRRQILQLRTVQGLSIPQIAERYNVLPMTIRRIVTEK